MGPSVTGAESLAGNAFHFVESTGNGRVWLGTALIDDLQVARRTRARFGGGPAGES